MLWPMVRLSVQMKAQAIVMMTATRQPFVSKFLLEESGVPELPPQLGPPHPTPTLSFCQAISLLSHLGKAAKGLLAGGGREELMESSQTQTQLSATTAGPGPRLPLEGTRLLPLPEQPLAAMALVRCPSLAEAMGFHPEVFSFQKPQVSGPCLWPQVDVGL